MNSNSYFEIGSSHLICQDYALSGRSGDGGLQYGIISDGCSSSKHSEVGAQILSFVAKYCVTLLYPRMDFLGETLRDFIIDRVEKLRALYGLPEEALDATLFIVIYADGFWSVFGWGDGTVIIEKPFGVVNIEMIEYKQNAPYYLSYLRNCDRKERYMKEFNDNNIIQSSYGTLSTPSKVERHVEAPFFYSTADDEIKSITVCSDGISSYIDEFANPVGIFKMAHEFIGFKRTNGEFVKSNMMFLKRKMEREGIQHYDDISCATVTL